MTSHNPDAHVTFEKLRPPESFNMEKNGALVSDQYVQRVRPQKATRGHIIKRITKTHIYFCWQAAT